MNIKVVLKKSMVRNFVFTWSVLGVLVSFPFLYMCFPRQGTEYFYTEFFFWIVVVFFLSLIFMRAVFAKIHSLQIEIHEFGITFMPINSLSFFPKQKTLFWEDDVKMGYFLPFSKIRAAQKKKILDYLNFPYYALIPTRDWIENIDEVDAFLEMLPSNWLTEFWRKPGTALEMEGE